MVDVVLDLKSALKSAEPEIYEILTRDFRESLNKNIHVLDLSYTMLLSSTYSRIRSKLSEYELKGYTASYNTLIKVLLDKRKGKTFTSINDPKVKELVDKNFRTGPILIYHGSGENTQAFLIGSQFTSLQDYYSSNIASDPTLRATRFGKTTTYKQILRGAPGDYEKKTRIKTDFGHIPSVDDQNLTSPLIEKFTAVAKTTNNELIKSNVAKALDELYSIQLSISHRFKNTTPDVIETSRNILGTGYVVVTLQSARLNSKFSTEEGRIYSKLLRSIASKIDYASISGSNTIRQDIAAGIASIFTGKKLKPHKPSVAASNIKIKAKSKVSTSTSNLPKVIPRPETSTINLLSILQSAINQKVADNMGKGSDHRILNYRTGRFAESVKVERLSESRQGMISAFYSYMRNPYGTFSEGGRQESPKTRDPKLLISKSIREIAAPIVGARMRAVVI